MPTGFTSYIIQIIQNLFPFDLVTTAIWHVSFDIVILVIFCRTAAYASSVYNKLGTISEI
jgi:hypothetical protein